MLHPRSLSGLTAALLVVSTMAGCASHAADAGGDTALAHDLATVQLRANDPTYRAPASGAAGTPASAVPVAPESSTSVVSAAGAVAPGVASVPASTRAVLPDTAPHTCTVATRPAQTECFRAQIAPSSARLDHVYQSLLTALRAQAPARVRRGGDPPAARQLRAAQQAWAGLRERECRRREGAHATPHWAASRAQCYAEFSTARANELDATLARVRGTSP